MKKTAYSCNNWLKHVIWMSNLVQYIKKIATQFLNKSWFCQSIKISHQLLCENLFLKTLELFSEILVSIWEKNAFISFKFKTKNKLDWFIVNTQLSKWAELDFVRNAWNTFDNWASSNLRLNHSTECMHIALCMCVFVYVSRFLSLSLSFFMEKLSVACLLVYEMLWDSFQKFYEKRRNVVQY